MFINKIKSQQGFTLVEVLLALAVLSIIIIPFTEIFITSTAVDNASKRNIKATYLAQKYMEMAKNNFEETFDGGIINKNIIRKVIKDIDGFDVELISEPLKENTVDLSSPGIGDVLEEDFEIRLFIDNGRRVMDIGKKIRNNWFSYYLEEEPHDVNIRIKKVTEDSFGIEPIPNEISSNSFANNDSIVFKCIIKDGFDSKVSFTIDNLTNKKVIIYEYDDYNDLLKLDIGSGLNQGAVEIITNLITDSDNGKYSETVYKVTVNIYYKGKVVEKLISILSR